MLLYSMIRLKQNFDSRAWSEKDCSEDNPFSDTQESMLFKNRAYLQLNLFIPRGRVGRLRPNCSMNSWEPAFTRLREAGPVEIS